MTTCIVIHYFYELFNDVRIITHNNNDYLINYTSKVYVVHICNAVIVNEGGWGII
jgi:hypothetical protein